MEKQIREPEIYLRPGEGVWPGKKCFALGELHHKMYDRLGKRKQTI